MNQTQGKLEGLYEEMRNEAVTILYMLRSAPARAKSSKLVANYAMKYYKIGHSLGKEEGRKEKLVLLYTDEMKKAIHQAKKETRERDIEVFENWWKNEGTWKKNDKASVSGICYWIAQALRNLE